MIWSKSLLLLGQERSQSIEQLYSLLLVLVLVLYVVDGVAKFQEHSDDGSEQLSIKRR